MQTAAPKPVKIVTLPDPILRETATLVTEKQRLSTAFAELLGIMKATLDGIGVGLAAPQIGAGLRLFVMQDKRSFWKDKTLAAKRGRTSFPFTVVINPEWQPIGDALVDDLEGCLSIPGLQGMVTRHRVIQASWIDHRGRRHDERLENWKARIFQHEYDHLDGKLYTDMLAARPEVSYRPTKSGISAGLKSRLRSCK